MHNTEFPQVILLYALHRFRDIVFVKAGERGNAAFRRIPDPDGKEMLRTVAPRKRRIYVLNAKYGMVLSISHS